MTHACMEGTWSTCEAKRHSSELVETHTWSRTESRLCSAVLVSNTLIEDPVLKKFLNWPDGLAFHQVGGRGMHPL